MHVGGGGCDGIYRRLRNADGLREGGTGRGGRERAVGLDRERGREGGREGCGGSKEGGREGYAA